MRDSKLIQFLVIAAFWWPIVFFVEYGLSFSTTLRVTPGVYNISMFLLLGIVFMFLLLQKMSRQIAVILALVLIVGQIAFSGFWLVKFVPIVAQNFDISSVSTSFGPEMLSLLIVAGVEVALIFVSIGLFDAIWRFTTVRPDKYQRKKIADSGFADKELSVLKGEGGYLIGAKDKERISTKLNGHVLVFAPPRSGKNVSVISPNMAAINGTGFNGPVVAVDPKGEIFSIWYKRRQELGRKVHLLDPFGIVKKLGIDTKNKDLENYPSSSFNPLDLISDGPESVSQIYSYIDAIIPEGKDETNKHFNSAARTLLAGLIEYVKLTQPAEEQNFVKIRTIIEMPQSEFFEWISELSTFEDGYGLVKTMATFIGSVGSNERGSILSTFSNAMQFTKFPEMMDHFDHSDFSASEIIDNEVDVFLVAPKNLVTTLAPWLRLWITVPLELSVHKSPKERVTLLVDEMKALGYIAPLNRAFNLEAGMGTSIVGITQHPSDLKSIYGVDNANAMIAMSQVVHFFNVGGADVQTQKLISDLCGETVVEVESGNLSRSRNKNSKTKSVNRSVQRRRLMHPDEVSKINPTEQVVFVNHPKKNIPPILCDKIEYYSEKDFSRLAEDNPYLKRSA